jgi:DNA processing protein
MMNTEMRAWLRLMATPRVGNTTARKLLAAMGSPEAIVDASVDTLQGLVGVPLAMALKQTPERFEQLLAQTESWLTQGADRHLVPLGSPHYPQALLEMADPPLLLHVMGQLRILSHPRKVAMVGSRNPTPQGSDNARAFAHALSDAGVCVVSGLALGIDGAAHQGSLQGATGGIAVVGTGLDRVYPKSHHALAHALAHNGALVSEYLLGTGPLPGNFPKRNRIIAGLSQATLVVEATLDSGSLITANLANDMGREVLAIPGSIHAPQSKGCHSLIRQGAKLVESARDVLEDLQVQLPLILEDETQGARTGGADTPSGAASTAQPACAVLKALGYDPVGLDELQARTGMSTPTLQARLWELEMQGALNRLPGGLFQQAAVA